MIPRFSWPQYRQPWALNVTVERLEGADRKGDIDEHGRRVRLDSAGDWSEVELGLSASTTESRPDGIEEINVYVLVSSTRTNTRVPFPLKPTADSEYAAVAVLSRDTLAGPVEVQVQVVSEGERIHVVGESEPWTVVVDPSAAPPSPGAPPFDMAWLEFSTAHAPQVARDNKESYAVMDLTGPKPVLLLNSELPGFQSLLNSTTAKLERRRLRDTLGTSIARYALNSLFREAKAQITVEENDDISPPDDQLLRQVCQAVAAEMRSLSTVEELYERLGSESTATQVDRARLWAEIDNAIDRLTDHSETVATVCAEVRHA